MAERDSLPMLLAIFFTQTQRQRLQSVRQWRMGKFLEALESILRQLIERSRHLVLPLITPIWEPPLRLALELMGLQLETALL